MTELDTRPVVDPQLDDGDDDQRFSHYVRKEDILRSAVDGVPVRALCGKEWLPGRDPEKDPVWPPRRDGAAARRAERGRGGPCAERGRRRPGAGAVRQGVAARSRPGEVPGLPRLQGDDGDA